MGDHRLYFNNLGDNLFLSVLDGVDQRHRLF